MALSLRFSKPGCKVCLNCPGLQMLWYQKDSKGIYTPQKQTAGTEPNVPLMEKGNLETSILGFHYFSTMIPYDILQWTTWTNCGRFSRSSFEDQLRSTGNVTKTQIQPIKLRYINIMWLQTTKKHHGWSASGQSKTSIPDHINTKQKEPPCGGGAMVVRLVGINLDGWRGGSSFKGKLLQLLIFIKIKKTSKHVAPNQKHPDLLRQIGALS